MDFNTLIILIAIVIFIVQTVGGLSRKKQEKEPYEVPLPLPQEEEELTLFPGEVISPLPEEMEEEPPEIRVEKVALLEPAVPYEIKELVGIKYETEFTTERLKDGIILSTIIGPPKAYKFIRRE